MHAYTHTHERPYEPSTPSPGLTTPCPGTDVSRVRGEARCRPTRVLRDVRRCRRGVSCTWVSPAIRLRARYAMPGTDIAYRAIRLGARYATSGTDVACAAARRASGEDATARCREL
eukprot:3938185-Rhodomonas_salina.4